MVSLDQLPNEVLHGIASCLKKKHDLAALARANRHLYDVSSSILWKREASSDRPGALHWAAENGDYRVLTRALDAGVDPSRPAFAHKPKCRIEENHKWWNYHSTYYDDPLWRIDDDEMSVDLDPNYVLHDHCNCFDADCDDAVFNDCTWEPLHIAASKGRVDLMQKLLDEGADINGCSWGFCLCRPHLPIEAFQETRGVDEGDLQDVHGGTWSPLHVAMCHGQVEAAKLLLRHGASTTIYRGGTDNELFVAMRRNDGSDEEVAARSQLKLTALHHAARFGLTELCEFIVEEKYQEDLNCEALYMGTPLIQAIWHGHWEDTVPYLLERGANIDARLLETRLTPLMMACFSRRFDDATRLIDLGASVHTLSVHQFSILHLILGPHQQELEGEDPYSENSPTRQKSTVTEAEIIRKFLANGFPVDSQEALLGMTPLMVASASCNMEAMGALIEGGADVNALDLDGLTPLTRVGETADGLKMARLCDTARMLLDAGATFNDVIEDLTPLNIICSRQSETYSSRLWEEQHVNLIKLFVERGADPNEKGASSSRPFTEAIIHGNYALAQAILECGGRPDPDDIKNLLERSSEEMYDDGRTEYIVGLDFAKWGLERPSDPFFVKLIFSALHGRLWSRAADLMKVAPIPKEMRKGLMHRCLKESIITADDPSFLVRALLDLGEDPNELYLGEPPLLYSLKSAYCWRSTPILLDAGADVHLSTQAMPDGAFMYSVKHKYEAQVLQILAKHPEILKDRSERIYRECWESVIRWGSPAPPPGQPGPPRIPRVLWNIAKRLMEAGLKGDVTLEDGSDVSLAVSKAVSSDRALGSTERSVLELLGIEYREPDPRVQELEVRRLIHAAMLGESMGDEWGPRDPLFGGSSEGGDSFAWDDELDFDPEDAAWDPEGEEEEDDDDDDDYPSNMDLMNMPFGVGLQGIYP